MPAAALALTRSPNRRRSTSSHTTQPPVNFLQTEPLRKVRPWLRSRSIPRRSRFAPSCWTPTVTTSPTPPMSHAPSVLENGHLVDVVDQHALGSNNFRNDWMPDTSGFYGGQAQAEFVHLRYPGE